MLGPCAKHTQALERSKFNLESTIEPWLLLMTNYHFSILNFQVLLRFGVLG